MAYKGKILKNKHTGQQLTFLQTARSTQGRLLEMEAVFNPHSGEPPMHYHPRQEEHFMIIQGQLTVKIGGETKTLRAGDSLHIPEHTAHAMWNNSDELTIVNWKVSPALDTEYFLETLTGLAADGKTDSRGKPGLFQTVLIANHYTRVFRLAKPSRIIQRIVFTVLTPFAFMMGLRGSYEQYID
ncbi:MAG: cupin domain-containing protein [Chitinophagaceae bacterium]